MDTMIEVQVWCMDSWSGREKGRTYEFKTKELALDWIKKFNSKNNLPSAPEYYEYAELV